MEPKPEIDQISDLFEELRKNRKLSVAKWEKLGLLTFKLTRGSNSHIHKALAQTLALEHPEIRKGIRKAAKQNGN